MCETKTSYGSASARPRPLCRPTALLLLLLLVGLGSSGSAIGQELDNGSSVEGCVGCHAVGAAVPVGDNHEPADPHYIDLDPLGPQTSSGYRQIEIDITSVDVTGTTMIVEFGVVDENGVGVGDIVAGDGRLYLARLDPPPSFGDANRWVRLLNGERFTTAGGSFEILGGGLYRYTTIFDPTSVPIAAQDVLRAAIQLSGGGLPPGNGWCDFDANLSQANGCDEPVSDTRDIVQTAACNECHGATSDTKLTYHGARTEVEFCVVCHNPGIGYADFQNMVHKIHYGAELTAGYRDGKYDHVHFTRDTDNCAACHIRGGEDEDNWRTVPTMEACGSCHDDVNFADGTGHGIGGQQSDNSSCAGCHPAQGAWNGFPLPVPSVHQGIGRAAEGAHYRGDGDGIRIDKLRFDRDAGDLVIDYSVKRDGARMDLQTAPQWTNGGRLTAQVSWSAEEYTNEGSVPEPPPDPLPPPAPPVSYDALDFANGPITVLGGGMYRMTIAAPDGAFGSVTVNLEGRPVAILSSVKGYVAIPIEDAYSTVNIDLRGHLTVRRQVVDVNKCNACHDSAGSGLSFHGGNRTAGIQNCVACHNPDATDIRQRPASGTLDGKREEAIDFKRMIHAIHTGQDLENGLVIYGYGMNAHDYSEVDFIGNSMNCETCHLPGTYGAEHAWYANPTTVDTGADRTVAGDDLNISPISSVCSSCHDGDRAKQHMVLNGASFKALDEDVALPRPIPEPSRMILVVASLAALGMIARRRPHQLG